MQIEFAASSSSIHFRGNFIKQHKISLNSALSFNTPAQLRCNLNAILIHQKTIEANEIVPDGVERSPFFALAPPRRRHHNKTLKWFKFLLSALALSLAEREPVNIL